MKSPARIANNPRGPRSRVAIVECQTIGCKAALMAEQLPAEKDASAKRYATRTALSDGWRRTSDGVFRCPACIVRLSPAPSPEELEHAAPYQSKARAETAER